MTKYVTWQILRAIVKLAMQSPSAATGSASGPPVITASIENDFNRKRKHVSNARATAKNMVRYIGMYEICMILMDFTWILTNVTFRHFPTAVPEARCYYPKRQTPPARPLDGSTFLSLSGDRIGPFGTDLPPERQPSPAQRHFAHEVFFSSVWPDFVDHFFL